ncbi:MAG TPA: hypothetical protein VGV90_03615, partial [Solirubrobacteraceae bacterium]|nr:hypothetical protein [Solirubrobacteraceae bacterium]
MSPGTMAMRALLVGAPLGFAALLMAHPTGEGSFSAAVAANTTPWLVVHVGGAVLFPLMAYVVWLLLRGVEGRAARTARVALPVFAVFYGVWEALMGIATGIVGQESNEATGAARTALADTVDRIATHPIAGEVGVFNSVGSLAWVVGVSAAIVALRGAGVGRGALVLLGIGAMMVMHVPPFGPVALVCISLAGASVARDRCRRGARRAAMGPRDQHVEQA